SIGLLAIVFVAGVGRIAGAVVAGIMFSAAGLFVTFLTLHLSVGKYQAIVAGVALVLTAVQNPDGITGTATGKGPAVALAKLRDRAAGQYARRLATRARPPAARPAPPTPTPAPTPAPGASGLGPGVEGGDLSAESDRRPRTASGP